MLTSKLSVDERFGSLVPCKGWGYTNWVSHFWGIRLLPPVQSGVSLPVSALQPHCNIPTNKSMGKIKGLDKSEHEKDFKKGSFKKEIKKCSAQMNISTVQVLQFYTLHWYP